MTRTLLLSCVLLLAACAAQPPQSKPRQSSAPSPLSLANSELFDAQHDVIDDASIFELSSQQREHFLDHFNRADLQHRSPHQRVYDYIERFSNRFNYLGKTHTASDALRLTEGNCLSLAIVTTALARLADVPIGYQLVDSMPVFERKGNLVIKGRHVRTLLHHRQQSRRINQFSYSLSTLVVDYFPDKSNRLVRPVSEHEYIAMYYRNLAADALIANDLKLSFAYAKTSLQYAPYDDDAINLLAILHRRAGDEQTAENVFKFGIKHAENRLTLLNNYRGLLLRQGRTAEAARLSTQLADYDDSHPYRWLGLAHTNYLRGDYRDALRHYRRASDLAPYLHEAHFGRAKTHYQLGNLDAAQRSLDLALELAADDGNAQLYRAKLAALSEEL